MLEVIIDEHVLIATASAMSNMQTTNNRRWRLMGGGTPLTHEWFYKIAGKEQ